MIIFGTKGRSIKMDSGEFHCPNCNTAQEHTIRSMFKIGLHCILSQLFQLVVKKMNILSVNECSSIYHLDVIDHKPGLNDEEMASEYEKALQNVLCLMIIADNKVEDEEVKTVSDIFNKLTNDKKLSKAKIDQNYYEP